CSFNHLVGGHLQRQRHLQAERLRGSEIDHRLKPCRLLDRKLARLGASENLMNVACVDTYPGYLDGTCPDGIEATRSKRIGHVFAPSRFDCASGDHPNDRDTAINRDI